jgi:hypothetical protein
VVISGARVCCFIAHNVLLLLLMLLLLLLLLRLMLFDFIAATCSDGWAQLQFRALLRAIAFGTTAAHA